MRESETVDRTSTILPAAGKQSMWA